MREVVFANDDCGIHAELARAVETSGIDVVYCAGPLMRSLWDVLPTDRQGAWTHSAAELAFDLVRTVWAGDIVMVKGSKASKAVLIAQALATIGDAG